MFILISIINIDEQNKCFYSLKGQNIVKLRNSTAFKESQCNTKVLQIVPIHPLTNELVVSTKKIKEVVLDYCTEVLKNNQPKVEFKDEIDLMELLHDTRMAEIKTETKATIVPFGSF